MNKPLVRFVFGVALALVVMAFGWWLGRRDANTTKFGIRPAKPASTAKASSGVSSPARMPEGNPCINFLAQAGDARSGVTRHDHIVALLRELQDMPKDQALRFIVGFLDTKKDVQSGEDMSLGGRGILKKWPTERVALMDLLGRLDLDAAGREARKVLASPTTADEWAVSLRNLAWTQGGEDDTQLLKQKTLQLIQNPEWRAKPTAGYFEAFDVLVYTGATDATPVLSEMVAGKDRQDLSYAAFLSMDRLVMKQPAEMLEKIAADHVLQAARPEMLAGMFARADVRDERQRMVLEGYLSSPDRTDKEMAAFSGNFPNVNALVSSNLLTTSADQAMPSAARDKAAFQWLDSLEANPRFAKLAPYLPRMRERVGGFAGAK